MEDCRLDCGNDTRGLSDHRWQDHFPTPFAAPSYWCCVGLGFWCRILAKYQGEEWCSLVQLLERGVLLEIAAASCRKQIGLVGAVGIEPTTFGLKGRCSTTELRP